MIDTATAGLEHNVWHMFAQLGCGAGGVVHDTPTRLIVRAPVDQPPYNAVWRFTDEGDRPLDAQVREVLAQFRHDGVAGIYGVATVEAGRGKGLARLLTLTALSAARDEGASTSILHSTPMAHTLYERLGYRDVAPFRAWSEPGSLQI